MITPYELKWYKPIRICLRSIDFIFIDNWILTICFKGEPCCYWWKRTN